MYNTEGPEVMRLYSDKDNTPTYSFTDVLDSAYLNVYQTSSSGYAQNTITLFSFAPFSMLLSLSGPFTIPMKKVLSPPGSEENTLSDVMQLVKKGIFIDMKMHFMQALRCCLPC